MIGVDLHLYRKGGASVPAWSPLDLGANLIAWWKSYAGVLTDAAGAYQLEDHSGNGHHQQQATDLKKPQLVPDQQNGRPGVVFDAVDDAMQADFGGDHAQPNAIAIAYRRTTIEEGSEKTVFDGNDATKRHALYQDSASTAELVMAGVPRILTATADTNARFDLVVFNGGGTILRRNAVQEAVPIPGLNVLSGLTLSAYVDQAERFGGIIFFEGLALNAVPTPEEIANLEAYINAGWALW